MPAYPLHDYGPRSADVEYISSVLLLFVLHSVAFQTLLPRCGCQGRISQNLRVNLAEVWTWVLRVTPRADFAEPGPHFAELAGERLH